MRSKILFVGILLGMLAGCSSTATTETAPLPLNSSAPVITPVSPATSTPPPTPAPSIVGSGDTIAGSTDVVPAPIDAKCLEYMAPVREYYRASDAERAKTERIDAVAALLASASQYCTPDEYVRYLEAVKAEIGA